MVYFSEDGEILSAFLLVCVGQAVQQLFEEVIVVGGVVIVFDFCPNFFDTLTELCFCVLALVEDLLEVHCQLLHDCRTVEHKTHPIIVLLHFSNVAKSRHKY